MNERRFSVPTGAGLIQPRLLLAAAVVVAIGGGLALAPEAAALLLAVVGLGLPFLWLVWQWPGFGLLGLTLVLVGLVPFPLPEVRLLGAGLETRDLALFALLGLAAVKGAAGGGRRAIPWWGAVGPLLALVGLAAFSALNGVLVHGAPLGLALRELRPFAYYLVAFVALAALGDRRQVVWLVVGLFLVADLVALVVVAQQALGTQQVLFEQMYAAGWEVRTMGGTGGVFGSARVVPPGHVFLTLMLVVAVALLPIARPGLVRALLAAQALAFGLASLLTYTRAQWLTLTIAVLVVLAFTPLPRQARAVRRAAAVVAATVLLVAGIGFVAPATGNAFLTLVADRALSVADPNDTLTTDSLQWRAYENEEALATYASHPVLGIGLGASYREPSLVRSEVEQNDWGLTRFIHNAYLYLLVKMGLLGPALFAWFALAFLGLGWRALGQMAQGVERRLLLGVLATFAGLLQWLWTQPHLFFPEGTAAIGLMLGLAMGLERLGRGAGAAPLRLGGGT